MRHSLLAVLVAILLAVTTSCGGRDDRAVTIEESDDTDSQAEQPEAEAPGDSAGQQLTQKQVDAALLTVGDLPSGWTLGEESDEEDEDDEKIEPSECAELIDSMDADEENAVAEGDRDFNKGGPFGTLMGVSISSYEDELDGGKLKDMADAFSQCSSFKGTDSDGVVSTYKVAPLSLANIGDDSLALTMTVDSESFTIPINVYLVVVGHNLLTFFNGGIAGADGAQLETIGKLSIKRLEETLK